MNNELYETFCLHQLRFGVLLDGGVFDIEYGKAEINIHANVIHGIVIHNQTYRLAKDSKV